MNAMYPRQLKRMLLAGLLLAIGTLCSVRSYATVYSVTNTTDGNGTNQLRGALMAADQSAGPHTINIAAGTYNITMGTISFGNIAQTINIVGAGAGSTIINMAGTGANLDRIFFINPPGTVSGVNTSISGVTFKNGHLSSDAYGGGAILAGGPNNTFTLTNCAFSNNTIDAAAGTTGGAVNIAGGGTATVTNCTFTNNSNPVSDGGALYFFLGATNGSPGSFTVTGCTFTGNTAAASGGAIGVSAGGSNTFSCSIQRNIFTGNTASGGFGGGAIVISNVSAAGSTSFINYNRFVGNTASAANSSRTALAVLTGTQGNVDASNNWWGCNIGAGGCADKGATTGGGSGTYTFNPYLQLKTTAATATCAGTGVTATAGFTVNSAGTTISAANLTALAGLPVSFSAANGAISNAQAAIQSSGTATATITPTVSPATINAMVDNVPAFDAIARATITVNAVAAISTPPAATTVCAGSTATFTVAASGSGTLSYQWRKGTTALSNGTNGNGATLAGATTATLSIANTTAADAGTDYNVVVTSSLCGSATSANAALTVNAAPAIAAGGQPSSVTPCPGNTVSFTVAATGTAPLTYQWYKGSTVLTNGATGTGSAVAGATTATLTISNVSSADNAANYNVKVSNTCNSTGIFSAQAALTVNSAPTVSVPATVVACTGTTATFSATVSGTAPLSYQWRKGTTNLSDGASGNGSTIAGAATSTLSITNLSVADAGSYNVVVTNTCASQPSGNSVLTVNQPGTWLGTAGTEWSNPANWSCGTLPTTGTNVTIPAGTTYSPLIDITTATANNITIAAGAGLGFAGSNNAIAVYGTLGGPGTYNAAGGKTTFAGSAQAIPAYTYGVLQIAGGGIKTPAGPVTVTGTLTLGSGYIQLGSNTLTIGNSGSITGSSSSSFIVTDGTGGLVQNNIGAGGRTGAILFPVGSSTTSYTPLQLDNSAGVADAFTASVINHIYSSYNAADVPTGTTYTTEAVDRTWKLKEATVGGSNATLTLQWNTAEELPGFTRAACKVSHYTGGTWVANPISGNAAGSNPYSVSMSGITGFSPFGVGGGAGSPLPVVLQSFNGQAVSDGVLLSWRTANEKEITGFSLERSEDGSTFHPFNTIATSEAARNSYQYTDASALTAGLLTLYYRLQLVGQDGSKTTSATIRIAMPQKEGHYIAYPNPVSGNVLLVHSTQLPAGSLELVISDMSGRECYRNTYPASVTTAGDIPVSLATLKSGTYLLHCTGPTATETMRIIKQ